MKRYQLACRFHRATDLFIVRRFEEVTMLVNLGWCYDRQRDGKKLKKGQDDVRIRELYADFVFLMEKKMPEYKNRTDMNNFEWHIGDVDRRYQHRILGFWWTMSDNTQVV